MAKVSLTPDIVRAIEDVLNKGNHAEVKIERGKPEVIAIKRKKVTNTTSE